MPNGLRVLWVTAIPPDFDGGGGHIRQAHLLRAVGRATETHLLVAGRVTDERVRDLVASVTEVDVHQRIPASGSIGRRLWVLEHALLHRHPSEVATHAAVRRRIRPLAVAFDVDVVVVEFAALAPLLPRRRDSRWVLTFHNLLSGMAEQQLAIAPKATQRWTRRLEIAKARRLERWAAAAYDTVVAVSDDDAATLGGNAVVVPNGVDLTAFRPSPLPAAPHMVLTGALYTRPNADGAVWFCHEVLPLVRAAHPTATLAIVGRRPPPEVRALEGPGVSVHADVPSTVPFLREARVAVVPLRIGTGSRLKALEAMAAGRPAAGTTIGFEGLAVRDGVHVEIADDSADLAGRIAALLDDDTRAGALASAGRLLVEQRYGWDAIGQEFLTDVLGMSAGS